MAALSQTSAQLPPTSTSTPTPIHADHPTHKFPHVLIVGAGIGGLLLAQCLRKRGVSFEIFERDRDDAARAQGWSIALHSILDDILAAVPSSMPPIEQVNHLLPLDLPAQICFHAPGGKKFAVESSPEARIIRANRAKLRAWLSTDVPVQWGITIEKIIETKGEDNDNSEKESESDGVELWLSDGRVVKGDVLVGADGVNSQVRRHLFPSCNSLLSNLPYASIIGEPHVNQPIFHDQLKLGHSAYVAIGPDFHLFVGLKSVAEDAKSATYYWFVNWMDETAAEGREHWTHTATAEELRDFAIEKVKCLDPKFQQIVRATKVEEIRTPPLVLRDMELNDMPRSRTTLLGDAVHPMAPFRGEGGLHAMRDALNLANTLSGCSPKNILDGLDGYQQEMLTRGIEAVRNSRNAASGRGGAQYAWGKKVVELP